MKIGKNLSNHIFQNISFSSSFYKHGEILCPYEYFFAYEFIFLSLRTVLFYTLFSSILIKEDQED